MRLTGNFSRLTGEGEACGVSSDNASGGRTGDDIINNGVVNVGPAKVVYDNINFWAIDSICIQGSSTAWSAYQKKPYPNDVDKNDLCVGSLCAASNAAFS